MTSRSQNRSVQTSRLNAQAVYPFSAIVGQEEMKLGLILNAIDPLLGGVLIMGHRGTGKSTAVRALGELLPQIFVAPDCMFSCDPADLSNLCADCHSTLANKRKIARRKRSIRVVELPLGSTEDRVCGSIDIQRALTEGTKSFEPGVLARANRGFLYIDEVNLLEDHLVDLLLDVAATGRHKVERESISVEHPARFVLIGSGNPEEGELRPQLLDRFGLHVEISTENNLDQRVAIVERRELFENDRQKFLAAFSAEQEGLRTRISRAGKLFASVKLERGLLRKIAELCSELKLDGHRGELTITRAARALAALENRRKVSEADIRRVAPMALRHRLRREPFEETGTKEQIDRALEKVFNGVPGNHPDEGDYGGGDSSGQAESSAGRKTTPSQARASGAGSGASASVGDQQNSNGDRQLSPPRNGQLATPDFENLRTASRGDSSGQLRGRRTTSASRILNRERGRYSSAVIDLQSSRIAVDATLRALSYLGYLVRKGNALFIPNPSQPKPFPLAAIRHKQFTSKRGSLYILAIDASGSMAPQRISRAREVALGLLRNAYIKRDSVAIVVFRGDAARVVLPPSKSSLRAKGALDCLMVGGGTPLSAGVLCSLELAKRSQAQHGEAVVLLFTDGRANVSLGSRGQLTRAERNQQIERELSELGRAYKQSGVSAVVVDVHDGFSSTGDAPAVAENLGCTLVSLGAKQVVLGARPARSPQR